MRDLIKAKLKVKVLHCASDATFFIAGWDYHA
jgi:hypothetical protein